MEHIFEAPEATITEIETYNFKFDDENLEQTFTIPESGYYKLEVWGAQEGSVTDYHGGYSREYKYLKTGDGYARITKITIEEN